MKTYLVRVYSDIVGSGWYLVRSESEEAAMNAIDLSRETYDFSIEDLDRYDGCESEDCGCSMDCDPTDHLYCDCEECDEACSNKNCKGEVQP